MLNQGKEFITKNANYQQEEVLQIDVNVRQIELPTNKSAMVVEKLRDINRMKNRV